MLYFSVPLVIEHLGQFLSQIIILLTSSTCTLLDCDGGDRIDELSAVEKEQDRFVRSTKRLARPERSSLAGLFAAHSVRDMKLRAPTATSRRRTNSPASFSHPSLESRQQPHRSSRNGAEQHDRPGHACLISRSRSNGFPPSTIKHQKFRPPTATPPLPRSHPSTVDPNESSPRMAIMQSHGSARLKSEIDYLQHKLKRHGETSKSVRIQDGRVRTHSRSYLIDAH